jgi:membrane protein implicated in regulation of membrane protease activity
MDWWIWLLGGLALLVIELATPGGLFFMFFGAAALVVGVMAGLGLGGPDWLQFLIFSVLSVGSLLLFRGPLLRRLAAREPKDVSGAKLKGSVAVVTEDVPPHGIGKAELRGTLWSVQNAAARELRKGERCTVERVEGLMLIVHPERT